MIENPYPTDWRQLQAGVCQLFNEIGLTAETEKKVTTPRGEIEIDVFAVDENSVDKIRYATECKNWTSAVPQHVVHSFMTVMQETGANVGFIVSREPLPRATLGGTVEEILKHDRWKSNVRLENAVKGLEQTSGQVTYVQGHSGPGRVLAACTGHKRHPGAGRGAHAPEGSAADLRALAKVPSPS